MSIKFGTPLVHCENISTIALAHNLALDGRRKDMEVDLQIVHIRGLVMNNMQM